MADDDVTILVSTLFPSEAPKVFIVDPVTFSEMVPRVQRVHARTTFVSGGSLTVSNNTRCLRASCVSRHAFPRLLGAHFHPACLVFA